MKQKHPDRPPLGKPTVEPALDLQPQFQPEPKQGDRAGSFIFESGFGWYNPAVRARQAYELNHPVNFNAGFPPNQEGDIQGAFVYREGTWHPISNQPPRVFD